MKTKFNVNNFRTFNNIGADMNIAPLTILTGCNSSGKSSFIKAMILLSSYLDSVNTKIQNDNDCELVNEFINFSSTQNRSMGRFEKLINKNANPEDGFSFSYSMYSKLLAEEIKIKYTFVQDEKDELGNGWLSYFEISKIDETRIFSIEIKDRKLNISKLNMLSIKDNFLNWAGYICGVNLINSIDTVHSMGKEFSCGSAEDLNEAFEGIKPLIAARSISDKAKDGYLLQNDSTPFRKNALEFYHSIKDALRSNIIFYTPVLDEVNGLSKEEAISVLNNLAEKNKEVNGAVFRRLSNIINDFEISRFELFIDYYRFKEEEFLDNYIKVIPFPFSNNKVFSQIFHSEQKFGYVEEDGGRSFCLGDGKWKELPVSDFFDDSIVPASFLDIFEVLVTLYEATEWEKNCIVRDMYLPTFKYKLQTIFYTYLSAIVNEAFSVDFLKSIKYVGSNRINIQRLYSFDNSTDFTKLLLSYFSSKRDYTGTYKPDSFINKWIKIFGIGESIEIDPSSEGLGALIYINKEDGDRTLLADEGYGISQLVSVILELEVAILNSEYYAVRKEGKSKFLNLGKYTKDEVNMKAKPQVIVIEEPEVHLHPKYQSMLVEMFVEAYKEYNINLIIETHSEYLIRKFQNLVALKQISADEVAINYVEGKYEDNKQRVRHIEIQEDGRLKSPFGAGFLDEADNLAMNLLTIKAQS